MRQRIALAQTEVHLGAVLGADVVQVNRRTGFKGNDWNIFNKTVKLHPIRRRRLASVMASKDG